jgi:hypothetical protein
MCGKVHRHNTFALRGSSCARNKERNILRTFAKHVEWHSKRYLNGVEAAPKWTADCEDEMKGGSI